MAAQIFPFGTALTVVWHLTKPDGTSFDLSGYGYRAYYRTGNKETLVNSTNLSRSGNTLSVTIPADEPVAPGEYALRLVLYQNQNLFCTLNYNAAFVLSRQLAKDSSSQTQEQAGNVVHLYTVAEFYLLAPVVPTVGDDGYWYVNGAKITDGNGEYIPSNHTVRYDSSTRTIIIDEGRVDKDGHSIQQTITDIDTVLDAVESAETTRQKNEGQLGSDDPDYATSRIKKEIDRQAAETTRQSSETARLKAEGQLGSDDPDYATSRIKKESDRQAAETSRAAAETDRATKETARQKAEGQLGDTDPDYASSRIKKEIDRQTAETARANAETQRLNNEGIGETDAECAAGSRRKNESERVAAEALRVQAETAREEQASADHTTAVSDHTTWAGYRLVVKTVGDTAPGSPSNGDKWYKTTDNKVYTYSTSTSDWDSGVAATTGATIVNSTTNDVYVFNGSSLDNYADDICQLGQEEKADSNRIDLVDMQLDGTGVIDITNDITWGSDGNGIIADSNDSNFGSNTTTTFDLKASTSFNISSYAGKTLRIAFPNFNTSQGGQTRFGICFYSSAAGSSSVVLAGIQLPYGNTEKYKYLDIVIDSTWKYFRTSFPIDSVASTYGPFFAYILTAAANDPLLERVQNDEDKIDEIQGLMLENNNFTKDLNPPRKNGSSSEATGLKGYKFLLTGLFDKGVHGVFFKGSKGSNDNSSSIVPGYIALSDDSVETLMNTTTLNSTAWYYLPITKNSSYLLASYRVTDVTGDAAWTPEVVYLCASEAYLNDRIDTVEWKLGFLFKQDFTLVTNPARKDNSSSSAGYYRGYKVDLTGLYAKGLRFIVFRGATGTSISGASILVPGIVAKSNDTVESYIDPVEYGTKYNGWFTLPITAESSYFYGSYCVSASGGEIWSPDIVYFNNAGFDIEKQIEDKMDERFDPSFDTLLLHKVYGVVGDTLQMFWRGITKCFDPYKYYQRVICDIGKNFPRYYEVTPEDAGDYTLKHRVVSDVYKNITKTATLTVAARPTTSPSSQLTVLCVGSSTTEGGQWPGELKRRLTGELNSGTPGADGLSNIVFKGRKDGTSDSSVKVEATGGWTWSTFYTPRAALRFTVSSVNSLVVGAHYTYPKSGGTVEVIVQEINVTEGSGNVLVSFNSSDHTLPSSQSGTLTRVSGYTGDKTVSFSAYSEETFCPFYDEDLQGAGFTDYVEEYCGGNVDVVIFSLGSVNLGIRGDSSFTLDTMKTLLDALHRDYPNAKAIIAPGSGYDTHYGVDYNYGASSTIDQWSSYYGCFRYIEAVQEFIEQDDYKSWCFMADTMAECDKENSFPVTQKAVNVRKTDTTETIGTNGQHPWNSGYMMTADAIYRCFVNVILNAEE